MSSQQEHLKSLKNSLSFFSFFLHPDVLARSSPEEEPLVDLQLQQPNEKLFSCECDTAEGHSSQTSSNDTPAPGRSACQPCSRALQAGGRADSSLVGEQGGAGHQDEGSRGEEQQNEGEKQEEEECGEGGAPHTEEEESAKQVKEEDGVIAIQEAEPEPEVAKESKPEPDLPQEAQLLPEVTKVPEPEPEPEPEMAQAADLQAEPDVLQESEAKQEPEAEPEVTVKKEDEPGVRPEAEVTVEDGRVEEPKQSPAGGREKCSPSALVVGLLLG